MFTSDRKKRIQKFILNPSILVQNLIFRMPRSVSQKNHIFVVGAPRSGTTLLKQILSTHQNLNGPGYETAIFMFKDIFSFKFSGLEKHEISNILQSSRDIVDFFDQFAEANLSKLGGIRFVEKTPPHVLKLQFLLKHFPNAQFINIFRDGRDCYCSAQHHPYVVQGRTVRSYAHYWKKCIVSRQRESSQQIFDVKYEDLVTNPEIVISNVMNFLGEEFDPKQIDSAEYSKNTFVNTQKGYFSNLSKSIRKSSQKRWMSEMTSEEVETFHKIAGHELESLGYLSN